MAKKKRKKWMKFRHRVVRVLLGPVIGLLARIKYGIRIEKFKEQGMDGYDFPAELDKTILEFKFDYLEVGDIIVYAKAENRTNTGMTSKLASTTILIYAGNNTLIEMPSSGAGACYTGTKAQAVLDASFKNTNDIFFLLRPSQAMDMAVED